MVINADILIAHGATYKNVETDEIIFQEGTEGHFYYQLVSGSVRWVNISEQGKEFIQEIVRPGDCFGEFPLFDDSLYAASAIANTQSVILRLDKNSFYNLLKSSPDLHFAFNKLLIQRLRFKFLLIKELASSEPEHKILTLFKYFKDSSKNICSDCNQILLTRQQVANMTGLRVETVIRAIKNLEQKGTVKINRGKVFYQI